jgi:hypothetical protein
VHGCWGRDMLGIDARQLGGVAPEHVGQHVREILPQVKPIRHLTHHGSPEARPFRIYLGTIPHEHLDPGMRLQPLRHGGGLPVGKQGRGPPPCEVRQEGAVLGPSHLFSSQGLISSLPPRTMAP